VDLTLEFEAKSAEFLQVYVSNSAAASRYVCVCVCVCLGVRLGCHGASCCSALFPQLSALHASNSVHAGLFARAVSPLRPSTEMSPCWWWATCSSSSGLESPLIGTHGGWLCTATSNSRRNHYAFAMLHHHYILRPALLDDGQPCTHRMLPSYYFQGVPEVPPRYLGSHCHPLRSWCGFWTCVRYVLDACILRLNPRNIECF